MSIVGRMRRTLAVRSRLRGVRYRIRHRSESPVERAIRWIKEHRIPGQGVRPSDATLMAAPEVTGYMIPTLYDFGEKELAREFVRWEASVQRPDGAVNGTGTNVPYTFDTAQVVRGFLAALDDMPEVEGPLRRACDYVDSHIAADGKVLHDSHDLWMRPDGSTLSEYGNLDVLPPMREAGRRLSEPRYIDAARRGMEYFRRKVDLVQWKPGIATLSPYWGYMMEALVELGEIDLAKQGLDQAAAIQRDNGGIPAWPGAHWTSPTGIAQLAIAWYKMGERQRADRAVDYLEAVQHASGGFCAGFGRKADHLPRQEIAWAVKYFLDACYWRTKCDADDYADTWMESIDEKDGRVQEIFSFLGNINGKRVLDIGCGKGRYVRVLKERFPHSSFHGLDVSTKMLNACPKVMQTKCGSLLNIGYPDASFDCAYAVEVVEHAMLVRNAIREMVRILKPRGKLLIIDKNFHRLGRLIIRSWERWFKPQALVDLLQTHGMQAQCKPVTYGHHTRPDGLFFAWEGIKRA